MKIIDNRLLAGVCVPGMSTKELNTQICANHLPHPNKTQAIPWRLNANSVDDILLQPVITKPSLMTRVIIGVVFTAGGTVVLTIYALRT